MGCNQRDMIAGINLLYMLLAWAEGGGGGWQQRASGGGGGEVTSVAEVGLKLSWCAVLAMVMNVRVEIWMRK